MSDRCVVVLYSPVLGTCRRRLEMFRLFWRMAGVRVHVLLMIFLDG